MKIFNSLPLDGIISRYLSETGSGFFLPAKKILNNLLRLEKKEETLDERKSKRVE